MSPSTESQKLSTTLKCGGKCNSHDHIVMVSLLVLVSILSRG